MINLGFFKTICHPFDIEAELALAIAQVESGLEPFTARYEPRWKYWYKVGEFASGLGITRDTEKIFQATSWGLMQVMGTVARELGFDRHLTELTNPRYNVIVGVQKLKELHDQWRDTEAVISAYNQGSPRKAADGTFKNQAYVSKVMKQYSALK